MKKHATLLTRKLGPLPFWAWAVVAGGVVYWYRNRQAAAGTSGVLGYTGPIPGAQGPPGPTGPPGSPGSGHPTPGSPGGRTHHPKPKKKKKRKHPKEKARHGRGGHKDRTSGHTHDHRSGGHHTHRAKPKRIIGKGRGRHITHSGVHHEAHGNRQVRNEPHHRNALAAMPVTPTKHSARNSRARVVGIRAALTSVSPIPRGAGRPRVGATLTAEGRNRGGGQASGMAPMAVSRNRIATPPEQGHVTRQAHPSRAARPIVLRGGRNPDHAEAARTPHTTSKQAGVQGGKRARRTVRRRAV